MPWVRLHAVKDYLDMVLFLDKFSKLKLNLNIVPALLDAIIDYTEQGYHDIHSELTASDTEHLTDEEALYFLELKWVKPLVEDLLALPAGVISELSDKIKSLEKKYSTTMSDVASRISEAQRELAVLTDELTGDADDLAGIALWRKELAK